MSNPTSVIPLESNPEIFTQFAHKLGLTPLLSFTDIYSIFEPELVQFLSRPIYGIILLFPITSKFEDEKIKRDETLIQENQAEGESTVKWFPQIIKNSCGFYALLHTIANLSPNLILRDSLLDNFLAELKEQPEKSTDLIEELIFSSNKLYENYSNQGQTEAPPAEDSVDLHFISFVKVGGDIYELDGRRKSYLKLGKAENEGVDIIEEKVIKDKVAHYIDLADEESKLKFSMIGLSPSE